MQQRRGREDGTCTCNVLMFVATRRSQDVREEKDVVRCATLCDSGV